MVSECSYCIVMDGLDWYGLVLNISKDYAPPPNVDGFTVAFGLENCEAPWPSRDDEAVSAKLSRAEVFGFG